MYRRERNSNDVICHDQPKMDYNEACLSVVNNLNTSITLKKKSAACYMCDMTFWSYIDAKDDISLAVDIADRYQFGVASCKKDYTFKQHGEYRWVVDSECHDVEIIRPPDLAYTPVFIVFGGLVIFCVSYKLIKLARRFEVTRKLCNKLKRQDRRDAAGSEVSKATSMGTSATTQISSDISNLLVPQIFCFQVFRGLVVVMMLVFFGNSNRYWFLKNDPWNGIMPADFVFPWFLWGMGAVFYLKYRASLLMGSSRLKVMGEVTLRSFKYVMLGVCLNTFEINYDEGMRYPGELPRSGVLHLIIFALEVIRMKKEVEVVDDIRKIRPWKVRKLPDSWVQYIFVIVCLAVHASITYLLPVPGCPTGYTGPGGLHMHSKYKNCTGGAARYIDALVFGAKHLRREPHCKKVYRTVVSFDTAGLLSGLNCLFTMYSGVYAAGVFVYYSETKARLAILTTCGVVQSLLGSALCSFSAEGGLPLNKQLWTLSFALLTSGTAFLVLALLHVLVDVTGVWLGSPLFEAGLNIMLLYAGNSFLRYSFPFSWTPIYKRYYTEFVIMDVITFSFWIFIAKLAYKHKRIFLV